MALPVTSPNSKLSLTSPKRGQKREEGWKEVVRRSVYEFDSTCANYQQQYLHFCSPHCQILLFSFIILLCIHLKARHCLHTKPMIACFLIELRDSYSTNINIIISRVLLKIKEAFCTSVRCVSDHGSRRLQHNSHPGCDRSSHWRGQAEGQEWREDDHYKVKAAPSAGLQSHYS